MKQENFIKMILVFFFKFISQLFVRFLIVPLLIVLSHKSSRGFFLMFVSDFLNTISKTQKAFRRQ